MSTAHCSVWLGLTASLAVSACQRQAPLPHSHRIVIQAENTAHAPLGEVLVMRRGKTLGRTDASGTLTLQLAGREGERLELDAQCPASFVPERQVVGVTLRRLQGAHQLPTYRVACQPATRTTVVAVRATGGPDLPVMYLGREIARTDASGVAHVALTLRPGERYELGLDTNGKPLEPKSPRAVFVAGGQDEMVFFDQHFKSRKKAGGGHARSRLPTAF